MSKDCPECGDGHASCECPLADSYDDRCPKCAGTGYVHDWRSGRRVPCEDCYRDDGPEEPR